MPDPVSDAEKIACTLLSRAVSRRGIEPRGIDPALREYVRRVISSPEYQDAPPSHLSRRALDMALHRNRMLNTINLAVYHLATAVVSHRRNRGAAVRVEFWPGGAWIETDLSAAVVEAVAMVVDAMERQLWDDMRRLKS